MSRNIRLYFTGFIIFLLILFTNISSEADNVLANKQEPNFTPLLLNSGLTGVSEAEVRVIFWFEEDDDTLGSFLSKEILSQSEWKWETHGLGILEENRMQGSGSRQALTISGYRLIDASKEEEILNWFRTMTYKVEVEGGKAYFDERVKAGIDGQAYLRQNNFELKQAVISGKTTSIAGWQDGFFPAVKAGHEPINIQLLKRNTPQGAITVLAIPVLLEEF